MHKCVCDICGSDSPEHNYKIKERKLYHRGYVDFPLVSWDTTDICNKCFNVLSKLRFEQDLEKEVTDRCFDKYTELYPNDVDLQSAYLHGVQDVMDLFIQNKIINQRK